LVYAENPPLTDRRSGLDLSGAGHVMGYLSHREYAARGLARCWVVIVDGWMSRRIGYLYVGCEAVAVVASGYWGLEALVRMEEGRREGVRDNNVHSRCVLESDMPWPACEGHRHLVFPGAVKMSNDRGEEGGYHPTPPLVAESAMVQTGVARPLSQVLAPRGRRCGISTTRPYPGPLKTDFEFASDGLGCRGTGYAKQGPKSPCRWKV